MSSAPGRDLSDTRYKRIDHVVLWVGNAKQAASYYVTRMGFAPLAYRGLETGHRAVASHVVRQNGVTIVLQSPLLHAKSTNAKAGLSDADLAVVDDMGRHIVAHGDGVRDVAFEVEDAAAIYKMATDAGATSVRAPWTEKDEHGAVQMASVLAYADTIHTFVQRGGYRGVFLPNYMPVDADGDRIVALLPKLQLNFIDHVVGNQPDNQMENVVRFYERTLHFHRFWSVDDKDIHTKYSSLRSIVVAAPNEAVKMPINEPAAGLRRSQIQEFIDYYGDAPGIQHIALNTENIIDAVRCLRARGVAFLRVPAAYYDALRASLAKSKTKVAEDLAVLQQLEILVDFDDNGYLLQIFTLPVQDRPTLFYEIIQRRNHEGFGAGNFKSLFEALEVEQQRRGNLV